MPKIERTPLTRQQLTEIEVRCWKLDRLVQRLVTDQSVSELLDTIPDPTEEDFVRRPMGPRHLLHDGKLVTISPEKRISDYLSNLNIPPPRGGKDHKRVKSMSQNAVHSPVPNSIPSSSAPIVSKSQSSAASSSPVMVKSEVAGDPVQKITNDIRPSASDIILKDPIYGFDWSEAINNAFDDITDGMAALSMRPEGKGYFGFASSADAVRNLNLSHEEEKVTDQNGTQKDGSQVTLDSATSQGTLVDMEIEPSSRKPSDYLSPSLEERYIEAYFDKYHTSYPFVHKKSFYTYWKTPEKLQETSREGFEILKLTVCALGCWTLSSKDDIADLQIYQLARRHLGSYVFEHGNIFTTLSLTLLSNYIQKRNFPNTGWAYLGTSVRHALGLALHVPIKGANPVEQEIRNRIWWGLYIFDVGTAITWGRPIHLPNLDEIKIECVKNIPDDVWDKYEPGMPDSEALNLTKDHDFPTIYSGFIAQIKFTHISTRIYNRTLSNRKLPLSECLRLNEEIEQFMASLPSYLSLDQDTFQAALQKYYYVQGQQPPHWLYFARYRLYWRIKNLQIILFKSLILNKKRGLFEKTDSRETFDSITLCLEASRNTVQMVSDFYHTIETRDETRLAAWYAIYFGFHAIVIPMHCLLKERESKFVSQWIHDLHALKLVLIKLRNMNVLCHKFINLIDKTIESFQEGVNGKLTSSRHNSGTKEEDTRTSNKRRLSFENERSSVGSINILEIKKKSVDHVANEPMFPKLETSEPSMAMPQYMVAPVQFVQQFRQQGRVKQEDMNDSLMSMISRYSMRDSQQGSVNSPMANGHPNEMSNGLSKEITNGIPSQMANPMANQMATRIPTQLMSQDQMANQHSSQQPPIPSNSNMPYIHMPVAPDSRRSSVVLHSQAPQASRAQVYYRPQPSQYPVQQQMAQYQELAQTAPISNLKNIFESEDVDFASYGYALSIDNNIDNNLDHDLEAEFGFGQ